MSASASPSAGTTTRTSTWNRTGHSLQELPTEILEVETPAQELPRALGDHDRVNFGDALQASGQVRRLADHDLLAFSHRLAHHDEPRGDTDPDFQSHGALQRQPGDLFDHREPCSDGTFGVVLMPARKRSFIVERMVAWIGV